MKVNKGFTLVEMLVVVLIIGILASVGLPQYTRATEKARTAEAWQTLQQIYEAKRLYRLTNRAEPQDFADLDVKFATQTGANAIGPEFWTKNYHYLLFAGEAAACGGNTKIPLAVVAERSDPAKFPYSLEFCNGVRRCTGSYCKYLGFSHVSDISCATAVGESGGCFTD